MNWELIRVFAEVCKDFNISKAAERLGRSQSAVSQRLHTLEETLQTKLFDTKSTGLSLTTEGQNLHVLARGMSELYEEWTLRSKFESISHYESLEVEIGQTLATMWLPHYIDMFYEDNHSISLLVRCVTEEEEFLKNYGDIAISTYLENRDDIIQDYLMTFHIGLYASPKYLAKHGTPSDTSDLENHSFMSYGKGKLHQYDDNINELFRQHHAQNPANFIEINSGQSLVTLASKGRGIIALSEEYPGLEEANLVRILPQIENTVDIFVSVPKQKKNKKSAHIFMDFLHQKLSEQKRDHDEIKTNERVT